MTKVIIRELIFDEVNTVHIQKHSATPAEAIVAAKAVVYHQKSYNNRYLSVSRSGKRILALVIRRISTGKYYLVSARDASRKERRKFYVKEKK